MNILITMDKKVVAMDDLASLYHNCGFGTYGDLTKDGNIEKIYSEMAYGFFAKDLDSNAILGAARVLSDDLITSYIAEICVAEQYRGAGLGDRLLEAVTIRFNHTAIFTCGFTGMENFLKKRGLDKKQKLFACSRKPYFNDPAAPQLN